MTIPTGSHATSDHDVEVARTRTSRLWTGVAVAEVLAATAAVLLDLLVPSLVLLAMAAASLAVRRQGLGSLGLRRVPAGPLVLRTLGFAVVWTGVQLGLLMPLANHVSGTHQDLSAFADVEGSLPVLLLFLALSWTLAAFVEELAFRGYLLTRMREALGAGAWATAVAVVASSLLFGSVHSEQGRDRRPRRLARRGGVQRAPTPLPDRLGLGPGPRFQQHHRLRRVLPRRPRLRAVVNRISGPRARRTCPARSAPGGCRPARIGQGPVGA